MFCGLDAKFGPQTLLLVFVVILFIILGIVVYLYKTYKHDVSTILVEPVVRDINELPLEIIEEEVEPSLVNEEENLIDNMVSPINEEESLLNNDNE